MCWEGQRERDLIQTVGITQDFVSEGGLTWLKKKNERKPRDRILKYFKFHLCPNKLKYKFCISFSTQFHFLVLF